MGLLTNYSLLSAYGRSFDTPMPFGNDRLYGAELPFEAALSAGQVIAQPRRLGVSTDQNGPMVKAMLSDWRAPLLRCGLVG